MFNWTMPDLGIGIFLLIIWEVFWKGVGLWKSAKRGNLIWFIAILLINLFGIIPLIYLLKTKQLEPTFNEIQAFVKSKFKK